MVEYRELLRSQEAWVQVLVRNDLGRVGESVAFDVRYTGPFHFLRTPLCLLILQGSRLVTGRYDNAAQVQCPEQSRHLADSANQTPSLNLKTAFHAVCGLNRLLNAKMFCKFLEMKE